MLTIDNVEMGIPIKDLLRAVGQISPFCGQSDGRPLLKMLNFQTINKALYLCGTDGFALGLRKLRDIGPVGLNVCTDLHLEEQTGDYVKYWPLIPTDDRLMEGVTVTGKDMKKLLGKVPAKAGEFRKGSWCNNPLAVVTMTLQGNGYLTMSNRDQQLTIKHNVPVVYGVEVKINWLLLRNAVKAIGTGDMVIKFNRKTGPLVIESMDGSFKAVIMPVGKH